MPEPVLVISCEHAVNHVPKKFHALFANDLMVLESHRGYDPGALDLAATMAKTFEVPCFSAQVSRLLVDHNRSPNHPALWSEYSRKLPTAEREWLLERYYRPFRESFRSWLEAQSGKEATVVHLAVHSFAPVLDGRPRNMDVGILYDPQRCEEKTFGRMWRRALEHACPRLKVRLNAPYQGRSDCHQTTYRRLNRPDRYLAIELEINQALLHDTIIGWRALKKVLTASLRTTLDTYPPTS